MSSGAKLVKSLKKGDVVNIVKAPYEFLLKISNVEHTSKNTLIQGTAIAPDGDYIGCWITTDLSEGETLVKLPGLIKFPQGGMKKLKSGRDAKRGQQSGVYCVDTKEWIINRDLEPSDEEVFEDEGNNFEYYAK